MKRVYMPHAGHFIGGLHCSFHLNTYLPTGYIVSTVGEYRPSFSRQHLDEIVKSDRHNEPLRARRDDEGPEPLGLGPDSLYETMVFPATASESKCCPWQMADAGDLDMQRYATPDEAAEGHEAMCRKWESPQ